MKTKQTLLTNLDRLLTAEDIEQLFNIFLKRPVRNAQYIEGLIAAGTTIRDLVTRLRQSYEFELRFTNELGLAYSREMNDQYDYRTPSNLSKTSMLPRKLLLIGSCLMEPWRDFLCSQHKDWQIDFLTFNNASSLPNIDFLEAQGICYQICQVPLRSILPESNYFKIKYDDALAYKCLFEQTRERLLLNFEAITAYNSQFCVPTFVLNFITPQQNPMGRLQSRYYLGNLVHFIEELNRELFELIGSRSNCYFVDFDQIVANFGKKYFSDDILSHSNHGSFIGGLAMGEDRNRLEPIGDIRAIYTPKIKRVVQAVIAECEANTRTINQTDSLKLVIFDLDDTLWRGIAAEADHIDVGSLTEGWPLSILEAATYLWRRGILLALVSKNDEAAVSAIWEKAYGRRFSLDNFAVRKINWCNKSDNIRDILKEVNLLPESVLFVDDNPVERAAVMTDFPGIRVMDLTLAHWRRILLWAPELQRSTITDESVRRTEMIHAQIQRESARSLMSGKQFFLQLQLKVRARVITSCRDPQYARCFELLNKTNQFNTTGRRWEGFEIEELFASGGCFLAFEVEDIYTKYGTSGLMIIQEHTIEQFVLSCRVFGMEIERACLAIASDALATAGAAEIRGKIKATSKNKLSINLFKESGFSLLNAGTWTRSVNSTPFKIPDHINVCDEVSLQTLPHKIGPVR